MVQKRMEEANGGTPMDDLVGKLKAEIWRAYQDWGHRFPEMWRTWANRFMKAHYCEIELEPLAKL